MLKPKICFSASFSTVPSMTPITIGMSVNRLAVCKFKTLKIYATTHKQSQEMFKTWAIVILRYKVIVQHCTTLYVKYKPVT